MWVESHQSLSRHRKTLRVVGALKVDRHKLIGHLHELWWWGLDNADTNGMLGRIPPEVIAEGAGWPLKGARAFVDALTAAGFIDVLEQGYCLHDWADYAGKLNDQRELRRASNREAQARRRQRTRADRSANVSTDTSLTSALTHADTSAEISTRQHPTGPDLTGPNQTIPDPDTPTGANAPSPPTGKRRRVTIADDAFRDELIERYADAFGSRQAVVDVIDTAMGHKARLKCTDERAYLRSWIRRDALHLPGVRNGKTRLAAIDETSGECECETIHADLAQNPNSPCMCPVHGWIDPAPYRAAGKARRR